jgi:calcineurin-binding protein cabin-1
LIPTGFFLKAVNIDSSDVYIWYQIGETALKLNKFSVSKYGFEQSLKLDATHWPSFDNLVVIYYALGDYSCQ